jgi:hypothetical protein
MHWECIEGTWGYNTTISRTEVPGGWLVKGLEWCRGTSTLVSLTFIPDPGHTWTIEKDED